MAQNDRLDFLKRKEAGQRLLPELKKKLAGALEMATESLNLLPLQESDQICERASKSFPRRDELAQSNGEYPFLVKRTASEACKLFLPETGAHVFLILPAADRVGVLLLPTAVVNNKWVRLFEIEPDGFILVDPAFLNKVVVQVDKNEANSGKIFDFAAWGSVWSIAVREVSA